MENLKGLLVTLKTVKIQRKCLLPLRPIPGLGKVCTSTSLSFTFYVYSCMLHSYHVIFFKYDCSNTHNPHCAMHIHRYIS